VGVGARSSRTPSLHSPVALLGDVLQAIARERAETELPLPDVPVSVHLASSPNARISRKPRKTLSRPIIRSTPRERPSCLIYALGIMLAIVTPAILGTLGVVF
jgi:hypothetical protein